MILRNAVVSWLDMATSFLLALVLTPFLVSCLGADGYGLWLLFVSLMGLCGFLDLGMSSAVSRFAAGQLALGDQAAAARTRALALRFYLLVGLVVVLGFMGLALVAPYVFKIPEPLVAASRWSLVLLGLGVALGFPARVFEALLLARERHHLVRGLDLVITILRFFLIIWLLRLGGGLVFLSLIHLAMLALGLGLTVLLCLRLIKLGPLGLMTRDQRLGRDLLGYGRDTLLLFLGDRARQEIPTLLLGALAAPTAVAHFGVGARLINNDVNLVQTAAGVAQARFAALEARGEPDQSRDLLLRASLYASLAAGCLALGLCLLVGPFVDLWLGPDFSASAQVVRIMIWPVTLTLALKPCDVLLLGHGRQRLTGWVQLAEAALVVPAAWLLVPRWGVEGLALGVGAALLLFRPWVIPPFTCRLVGLDLGRFWLAGPLRAGLALALAALPAWGLMAWWRPDSWPQLFAAAGALTLICAAAFWTAGLPAAERRFWMDKLARRERGHGGEE